MESVSKEVNQGKKEDMLLEISPDELAEANYVRHRYREQLACHYIPDINIFREKIERENDPKKFQKFLGNVHTLASQFSHIAFELPYSLDAYDAKYQTNYQMFLPYPLFQKNFRFTVIMEKYNIDKLNFHKGSFFADCDVGYYIFVPKQDSSIISYLQGMGYSVQGERGNNLKIGHRFPLTLPFNNSDEIFFFSKHFLYYNIYNMLQICEKGPSLLGSILDQLLTSLRILVEGFFEIGGQFQRFSLRNYINNYSTTQRVYNKYIFSRVREFNKIHKSFLNALQIANATGKI